MIDDLSAIILAAGKGTRMRSAQAKVLHRVGGRPIIDHVLRAVSKITPSQILVIVGEDNDELKVELQGKNVEFVLQKEQLGTGHAVLQARDRVRGRTILIVPGDLPLLTPHLLVDLCERHSADGADLTVLSMHPEEPGAYGRLLRDKGGRPTRIVEARDATADELGIPEVNTGIYCVKNDSFLWKSLASLKTENSQGEYYLTDLVGRYSTEERRVLAVPVQDSHKVMGINSRAQLVLADRLMRQQKIEELLTSGVTILDPERTYIDSEVVVASDTEILPGTYLRGRTVIGSRCVIGPDCFIEDSTIEEGCCIRYSVVEASLIRAKSRIGPYAHLRPGADVGPEVRIGNFVEVKESRVRRGTKAGHLTYLGDSEVGEEVNIGAGTITCNYDGVEKHRTTIEDRAFIGSNTSLVAPVTIGEGAVIGAGSTITEDVPPGTLALGRARQVNKEREEDKGEER